MDKARLDLIWKVGAIVAALSVGLYRVGQSEAKLETVAARLTEIDTRTLNDRHVNELRTQAVEKDVSAIRSDQREMKRDLADFIREWRASRAR